MDTSFDLQPQPEICQDPSDDLSDHVNIHNHYHHQQYQQQQQQYQYPPPPPPSDASNRPQYYHPWSSSNLSLPSLSSMNSLSSLSSFDIGSSTSTLLGSNLPYPANAAGSSSNSLSSSLNASSFASSSSLDSFAASGALGASLSYPFVCPLEFEGLLQGYLLSLHVRKRSKALIEQSMADDCLMVLTNPENTKIFGPKFRWWVRKHFVYTTTTSMITPEDGSEPQQQQQCVLMDRKNGKPVCVKEKLYEKVAHFHEATGHGGRDKTFKAISSAYSRVPSELVGLFTKVCRVCHANRHPPKPQKASGRRRSSVASTISNSSDSSYAPSSYHGSSTTESEGNNNSTHPGMNGGTFYTLGTPKADAGTVYYHPGSHPYTYNPTGQPTQSQPSLKKRNSRSHFQTHQPRSSSTSSLQPQHRPPPLPTSASSGAGSVTAPSSHLTILTQSPGGMVRAFGPSSPSTAELEDSTAATTAQSFMDSTNPLSIFSRFEDYSNYGSSTPTAAGATRIGNPADLAVAGTGTGTANTLFSPFSLYQDAHSSQYHQDGGAHYANSTLPPLPGTMNTTSVHPLSQQHQRQSLHLGLYQAPHHPLELSFPNLQSYYGEEMTAASSTASTTTTASVSSTNGTTVTGMEDDKEAATTGGLYEDSMGEDVEPVSWYGGNRDISYFQPSSPQSRFDELTANHHSMSLAAVVVAASAAHESMASALLDPGHSTAMETVETASPLHLDGVASSFESDEDIGGGASS
ncbi:nascent polypeptide-associated complex subunit alpha [Entomortierella parvispora]|uniref:Nascent polypeptide-associated complex subunit alpha n=1 Tax=Entomortierella parvispora TaxID=205924 RepID=A0A9P3M237_9FUNG|nr:nascent polypeptide-associated complex subunit alpha [Entomortierella parvispora]